jgi:hypothetical protein
LVPEPWLVAVAIGHLGGQRIGGGGGGAMADFPNWSPNEKITPGQPFVGWVLRVHKPLEVWSMETG